MSEDCEGGPEPKKWGKGRTDPDTWWKKGCKSPNPNGRPKGSKNQKTKYMEAFGQKVSVNVDGKATSLTLGELGYRQLAQKSGAGDLKAIAIQMQLDERFDPPEIAPPTPEESAADYATLETWIALREKFRALKATNDGGS